MSDLDRVLGRSVPLRETTTTGDIAPVMVGGGQNARPKRPGLVRKKEDRQRRRAVAGVLGAIGEAADEEDYEETEDNRGGVIPANAEELDDGRTDPSGLNLKEPEFKKKNPETPKDEKEALMSPKAALVAPDVTPNSMTEIDPSEVPGGTGETFKAPDVTIPPPPTGPNPPDIGGPMPEPGAAPAEGGQDRFTTAMDVLLGNDRATAPSPRMESKQPISPEAAAAMFVAPVESVPGEVLLKQNQPMPDHKLGSGKVFESFRRFAG